MSEENLFANPSTTAECIKLYLLCLFWPVSLALGNTWLHIGYAVNFHCF